MQEKLEKHVITVTVNGIDAIITPVPIAGRWNVYVHIAGAKEAVPVGHEVGPFASCEEALSAGKAYASQLERLAPRQ